MTRSILAATVLTLSIAAGGCDDNSTPTNPSGNTNDTVRFTAGLLASNEVPPVTGAEANANGAATITFNLTRDAAGAITGASADFSVNLAGFPAGTAITAAHIHTGAAGQNGSFIVNLGLSPGEITLPNGIGTMTKTVSSVSAATAEAIINNPAGHYFNAHTQANPGGAARGQLTRVN
jgi:hypothetical protein